MSNFSNKKILIIDDDETLCSMYAERLKAADFKVIKAFNGKEGLKKTKEEKPDLILLDIMMPEMDGYEVFRKLKKGDFKKTPVIFFLTALIKDEKKVKKMEKEMGEKIEYITKSQVMPGEVVERIKERFKKEDKGEEKEKNKD